MNILSVDYDSVTTISGISTFNRSLKLIFNDEINFLTLYYGEPRFNIDEYNLGIKKGFLIKLLNYFTGYRMFAFLINKKIEKSGCDVLIVNSPSLLRYVVKSKYKRIILVQHQDFNVMMKNKSNFGGNDLYMKCVFDKISDFIALSEKDAIYIKSFLPEKFHIKISAINHMSWFTNDVVKKERNNSLVMLGRLDLKQKRQDLAIRVMKKLPNWTLHIYGDGDDRLKIESILSKENIKNVFLKGPITKVKDVLNSHDIYLMTSDYEGYSLTVIEAMSCGLPLIIRDTFTSASDAVSDNGMLLSKNWSEDEFIEAVYAIDSDYDYFSYRAYENSKRFSFEIVRDKWLKLTRN
ncbi:hypothetical protein IW01_19545 [Pectobacterium brasiliense]|uniref:glycosyltransferase n=1 Tax=Pectobacterium brasiliense TaxID=180957 RepID=UPI0004E6CD03|nr:glycosyltransferase [Pectobacterium brasiliense]KFF63532.1 hypothetical protein IW01_19545 [Pectobacterium brasiliense]